MTTRMAGRVGLVMVALGAAVATAASLSDFKDAVGREGCESIPYSSPRDSCQRKQSDADEYCKGSRGKSNCDDLNPEGLKKQIENVKQKLESLKRERDDLSSKKSSAKDDGERRDYDDQIAAKDKEIQELQSKIDEWQQKLDAEKHAIDDRIYVGDHCLTFRQEVAETFASAKRSAKGESDPEIVPLAQKLVEKWERGEPGHAEAINNAKTAVEKCRSMR